MAHWKVTIKEKNLDMPITSEYVGDDYFDEKDCVEWWGLHNDDVEWYRLERIA